jgi:hypothetical protein
MPQSKAEIAEERKANLPLPEQPPVASDFNSADSRTVNVGSGGTQGDISHGSSAGSALHQPATGPSDVRVDGDEWKTNATGSGMGRQAKDGLDGLPNDAVTRDAKNKAGTVDTTNPDPVGRK